MSKFSEKAGSFVSKEINENVQVTLTLEKSLEEKNKEVEENTEKINILSSQLAEQKLALAEKEKEIEHLKEKNKTNNDDAEEIKTLSIQLIEQKSALLEKEKEIALLKEKTELNLNEYEVPSDYEEIKKQIILLSSDMTKCSWLIGQRLLKIRDEHLYEGKFEEFVKREFFFSRRTANRLIYIFKKYSYGTALTLGSKLYLLQPIEDSQVLEETLQWMKNSNPSYREIMQKVKLLTNKIVSFPQDKESKPDVPKSGKEKYKISFSEEDIPKEMASEFIQTINHLMSQMKDGNNEAFQKLSRNLNTNDNTPKLVDELQINGEIYQSVTNIKYNIKASQKTRSILLQCDDDSSYSRVIKLLEELPIKPIDFIQQ